MPTREEVYAAIRNADAAGDSAGVRKLGEYLKTLDVPAVVPADQRKPFDRAAFMLQESKERQADARSNKLRLVTDIAKSTGDTAASMASQVVLTPVAGIAGAVTAPFTGADAAANVVRKVQEAGYTPKSEAGQRTAETIGRVVEKANRPGEFVAEKTGSPALGAAVTTALQGAVAAADPAVRGAFRSAASSARAAVPRGTQPAPRITPTISPQATQAAQTYASSNGLDWNSLSAGIKAQLEKIAATSGDFSGLDPKALARQAQLEALPVPVPATRGQLAGDRVAIRNEGNVAATRTGQPIADIHIRANQALMDNLDVLKGKVSGSGATAAKATTPEEAGGAIQGAARGKQAFMKAKTNAAYKAARESPEGQAMVGPEPLRKFLEDPINAKDTSPLMGLLRGFVPEDGGGLTMANLERIRQKVSPATQSADGTVRAAAGDALKIIDGMMEGGGGELYAKARAAHTAERTEFGDQAAVADLVENASRTDRTTALSNTVKAVTSGAPEEIRQIKRTLLTGGDEATRTAGRQAWREVRAQVIQQIKDDATKGVGVVEGGAPNLTPSALNTALRKFGPHKLDEIFGPGTAKQLNNILDAAKTVKSIPSTGGGSVGSSTVQNALAFMERGLTKLVEKVPVVGKPASGAIQAASDIAQASQTVKQAQTTPLSEIANAAAKGKRRADIRAGSKAAARATIPLSEIAQGSRR